MTPTSRCRSCGQSIIWARTAVAGRAMPVDATPSPVGNIDLSTSENDVVPIATMVTGEARAVAARNGRGLHVSHFASCPNAAMHRKVKA